MQLATALEIAEEINASIRAVSHALNQMMDSEVERIMIKADPSKRITHSRGGFAYIWKIKGVKISSTQLKKYNEPETIENI